MDDDRDNISVRVASFSSYLDTACKDTFARGVSPRENNPIIIPEKTASHTAKHFRVDSFSYSPVEDPSKAFTFSQVITNPKNDNGEISVFGADKYFSMRLEYPNCQRHERRPIDLIGVESKIKPRTPSLCSEASSSFNSQSALIPNSTVIRRNESQTKAKKLVRRRRLFAGLGCHQVPCFDKKDFQAKDTVFIPTENTVRKKLGFSDVEESRTSIEVFGSSKKEAIKPNKGSSDVAASMERKLSMLTWDAIVEKKAQTFQTSSTTANSTVICDEMAASDASSDLFEIENISGTLYPMLASSSSAALEADNVGTAAYCMSPAYAPSEDSIQWSVVTASAADYSSVLCEFSDGDVMNGGNSSRKFRPTRNVVVGEKEAVQKGNKASGGILGCKNQKAVDVAEKFVLRKG